MNRNPHRRIPKQADVYSGLSISEVNDSLLEDYGHGIFPFALSLASHILPFPSYGSLDLWEKKNIAPDYWKVLKEEATNLKTCRAKLVTLIEELDIHLNNILYWDFLKRNPNYVRDLIGFPSFFPTKSLKERRWGREVITKEIYQINPALDRIDQELSFYESFTLTKQRSGRPIKAEIAITSLWSQVMKKGGRTQWRNLRSLMNWFSSKLWGTKYSDFCGTRGAEDIRRFMKNYKAEILKEKAQIFRDYPDPKNPMGLQIKFTIESPQIWGFGGSRRKKKIPILCFPDGTIFP